MHHEKMYLGLNLAADDLLVAKSLAVLHNCVFCYLTTQAVDLLPLECYARHMATSTLDLFSLFLVRSLPERRQAVAAFSRG